MDANNLLVDDEATPVANSLQEKDLEGLKPADDIKEQNFVTTTTGSTTNTTDVDISSEGVILEIPLQERSHESLKDTPVQAEAESYDSDSFSSESEEPDEDFSEQAELSDYKLLNKIGEGAFSRVFRATPQRDTSKAFLTRNFSEVAVKVISKKHLTSQKDSKSKATSKEQVLKEVAIHKAVSSSKNIVTFVDFQETQNYYFIVQELLAGGEIFGEIVRLTYFSEDLSRHVIKQLALAVKDMHSQGIVHRDIKPENLLFERIEHIPSSQPKLRKSDDPKTKQDEGVFRPGVGGGGIGVVKLADFGLSKQIYSTNTKTPCGTVGYTAPEVVKDERYSMQVDMWGIGCVLYTVLCGFPPFYDERVDVLTEKISRGEYTFLRPWWDEISDGAKYAVRKLLEVDPEKRYDIDEFLADPWLNQYDCLRQQTLKKHKNHSMENVHTVSSKKKKHRHQRWAFKKDSSLMYSPAAVAMRDAFEINNAVQRNEEDKRMTPGGVNLGQLQEDEETELEQDMFQLRLNSSTIIKRRKNKDTVKIPLTLNE
ncbi:LAFE_0F09472g1_1 [Lachancea fermentati]|uniref:non-specific serine/threonine protein kinase n=1 Tax=Lachancea fermentati TaxID=4955 RepID=A0A1G4MFK6_LACFM|nr:LAFE_0F09472g1_1 [Lachancea fermentati]